MPVTITTAAHWSRKWEGHRAKNAEELLQLSCPREYRRSKGIVQTSFSQDIFDEVHIYRSRHSFVGATWRAYSTHQHLILRPEDIWFSILTQVNFYIVAHAEELRSFFVSHEGQKELKVITTAGRGSADFGAMALYMTRMIENNIHDPDLRQWIMPDFSTTSESDRIAAAILMMGTMQKYFSYSMVVACGIPTVTLLGERDDWARLLKKLEKLPQLGEQSARFANLLQPVLRRFVASFDDPTSAEVLDFWATCIHHEKMGSGTDYLSGWITAFCFWDEDGRCLCNPSDRLARFELDGIVFHRIGTEDIPAGYASVPVNVNDNGYEYEAIMLAGLVGIQVTSSGTMLDGSRKHNDLDRYSSFAMDENFGPNKGKPGSEIFVPGTPTEEPGLDTLQPLVGWWMYEKN